MLTRREVFDKVKTHLLAQNAKAERTKPEWNGEMACAYRGVNGLSCAVGCLIADDKYDPAIEGIGIPYNVNGGTTRERLAPLLRVLDGSGVPTDAGTLEMLAMLQTTHDDFSPTAWRERLDRIEVQYFPEE